MENITKIQLVNANTLEFQDYQQSDENLISSFDISDIKFIPNQNILEYYILDSNKNLLFSEYNYKKYTLVDNNLNIEPKTDLTSLGFDEGQYYTLYHFLNPLFNSTPTNKYYISEISSDRKEIRIQSNILDPLSVIEGWNNFTSSSIGLEYYRDFYINFGDNNLVIANNALLDISSSILIKLYEPLSLQFDVKSELWIVEKIADSIAYFFELITVFDNQDGVIQIKGPNLNLPIKDQINNTTNYINYNLLQTSSAHPTSSLTGQLNNILNQKSIRLNIDYSDYNNFIHFSSAETRLENFGYKLSLIDSYSIAYASSSLGNNYYLTSSQNIYLNKIQNLIQNFDGYEYYLYFNSGSTSWPKSNSTQPYINYPYSSSQGQAWLLGQLDSASLYDSQNKDFLLNTVPLYLREDPQNSPYELFVEMLGQHFDTLYLYTSELTNKYNSDNRIDYGLSRDLISDALKDFGFKIYQNNFSTNDLYTSFLGINPNLGLLPPTGSELITSYITSSNQVIPLDDINNEIYKRLYHNLPVLFKKKGTPAGLRLLINTYGIPDTILRISEFGGKNRNNSNDWDQFQNQFNYAFYTTSSGFLKYNILTTQSFSESLSIQFRFKTTGIPDINKSQSLAYFEPNFNLNLVLEYTGSGNISGSYTSSIIDPLNKYGTLKLINNNNNSCSLFLPFFDGNWWSVMITLNSGSNCTSSLYAGDNIYSGYDGNQLGFYSSSILLGGNAWIPTSQSFYLSYTSSKTIAGGNYIPFSGSFQELRFFKTLISESVFKDYIMNPYSIESNLLTGSQSSLNSLIFRAPLGSDLDNISGSSKTSIHPSISNIFPTQSFILTGSSIYTLSGSYKFIPNKEIIYFDQFPSGIKNIISNKIRVENNILPSDGGEVLSSFRSIQQNYSISESYTRDINYLEVAFSPQNEINEDIISQFGYFNIGDYIGDPRQLINTTSSFYPDFNKLRDNYFIKYSGSYNLYDYIRLIKYFDNSLFKLIKDFTPARTSLASGIIIKQHLLERNKYSPSLLTQSIHQLSGSILSFPFGYYTGSNENHTGSNIIYKFRGRNGGVLPNLKGITSSLDTYPNIINITQSWSSSFNGPTGHSILIKSDQKEFLNGELSGSVITTSTGSLNGNNPYLTTNGILLNYKLEFFINSYPNIIEAIENDPLLGSLGYNPYQKFFNYFLTCPTRQGEIFLHTDPNNINYIKISKKDLGGNDLSQFLPNIQNIIINYSNNQKSVLNLTLYSTTTESLIYSSLYNNNFYTLDGFQSDYKVIGTIGNLSYSVDNQAKSFNLTESYDPNNYYSFNIGTLAGYYSIPTGSDSYLTGSRNTLFSFSLTSSINDSGTIFKIQFVDNYGLDNIIRYEKVYPANTTNFTGSFFYPSSRSCSITPILVGTNTTNFPCILSAVTFSISQYLITSSGNLNSIISEPYFNNIQNFYSSDYNILKGNVEDVPLNNNFYKVITDGSKVNNSYFNLIINNNADKSNVKDYYYKLKRHIQPRYRGSRLTNDNFNTSSIISSSILQSNLNIYLNPSFKDSIANRYDTVIYEFNSIDNPVELSNISRIPISQIIIADNTSSASTITKNDPNLDFIFKSQIKPNDQIFVNQYDSNSPLPQQSTVISTLIDPDISVYMLVSDSSFNSTKQSGGIVVFNSTNSVFSAILNSNKKYVTGSIIPATTMANNVGSSIINGDRWFISLYSGSFQAPINFPTNPVNDENFGDYLSANGIYEILTGFNLFGSGILFAKIPSNFTNNFTYGNGNGGMLLWKAKSKSTSILTSQINQGVITAGNFITNNASPFIKENTKFLSETFGNKP